ncbi:hypothetical protein [Paenibacillus sp. S150]|uniref:hypothetical protein n=1 Tax=Paenibacillus sp. S150 TaxID=2749826 RepID=UPI001C59E63F|nr:hypothetical protein [Paenibacillus sp. S150]MBW4083109.1 hypothetical protein [Paenibacillus sp. S150]
MRTKWRYLTLISVLILAAAAIWIYSPPGASPQSAVSRVRLGPEEPAKYLMEDERVALEQIEISLGRQMDPQNYISIPNHSEELWRRTLQLPAGEGLLIKFLHGGPAVLSVPDITEYWLCIQRPSKDINDMDTYYIEAQVTGDEEAAEQELLELAQTWEVPK